MRALVPRKISYYVLIGFLTGLILRYFMLFYKGTFDMDAYSEWGKKTLESGLVKSYGGIYFPFQYQIFEVCAWIAMRLGSSLITVLKSSNLLFDVGTFLLLLLLLKRQQSNPVYALLYWLHPWFLSVFSLGYIDFHFTFFVVLSLYCLRGDTVRDYLLSGIPLGLAFVMKPQAQILVVAAFFYAMCHYARTRAIRPLGMLVGPVSLFLAYEAYFTASLFSELRRKALYVLPLSYLNVTNVFPCLTGQMLNIWYPIAYSLKRRGDPIYSVSDQILLLPHLSARWTAATIVLVVLAFHVLRVERDVKATVGNKFIRMFGVATLLVPFIMTSAHENHLFLGSVFLVLFIATDFPPSFKLAAYILLAIQFLNIYGLYGEHPSGIALFLRRRYSEELAVVYSLISTVCFALVFKYLIPRERSVVKSSGQAL
jgi:hypothetical protein